MIGHVMQADATAAGGQLEVPSSQTIPEYLRRYYWWAYIHPNAVRFFERQWLVTPYSAATLRGCVTPCWTSSGRRFVDGRCK
jgi:hypothetical protein